MDEGIRGSHAQTTQHTLVLEGTHITHAVWHLSETDIFSVLALVEFVRSAFKIATLFFLF